MNNIPYWAGFALCLPAVGCQLQSTGRHPPQPLAQLVYADEANCSGVSIRQEASPSDRASSKTRIPYGFRWNDYQGSDAEHDVYGDRQCDSLATSLPANHNCCAVTRLFGIFFAAPAARPCRASSPTKTTVTFQGTCDESDRDWENPATPLLPPPPVPMPLTVDPPVVVETKPLELSPVETKPVEPTESETSPIESTPEVPVPVESAPEVSAPTESNPLESVPSESTPAEPTPTEPQPTPASVPKNTLPPRNELPPKVLPMVESEVPSHLTEDAQQPSVRIPAPRLIPTQIQPAVPPPGVTVPRNDLRENTIPSKPAKSAFKSQKEYPGSFLYQLFVGTS